MHIRPGRLRGTVVLLATIAMVFGVAAPAQAAPGQPGQPSGDTKLGAVRDVCATPTPNASKKPMKCLSLRRTDVAGGKGIKPNATPSGLGPAELRSAYSLPSDTAGANQTVAITIAYDNPNIEADLAVYRAQYGLPACTTANGCFRKVNQNGQASPLPAVNLDWGGESALDTQMVSAVCPSCRIVLVEANSNGGDDLFLAINTAVSLGAKFVSNSWGGDEYTTQNVDDEAYFNHPGVAITASSGDDGYGSSFPSASKYATSVGGTTLARTGAGRGWIESVWSGAGSGCSSMTAKPSFQTDTGCAMRTQADVSAVGDPQTGVAVYNTADNGWAQYGGTSVGAPIIAAIYALAGTPASGSYPNSYPYSSPSHLNDVTTGSNGSCGGGYLCTGTTGYDGPTGLGTPAGITAFAAPGPHGTLTGTVTDAAGNKALAGASVKAGTASTVTDANGQYILTVPAGTVDVTAAKYGYQSKTVTGVAVAEGATAKADFALTAAPSATVSGVVRDGSGHGWPLYAKITVDGVPGAPVYTDPTTGRYQLDLPSGATYTAHVAANYPGYQTVDQTIAVGSADVVADVSVPVSADNCLAPGYARKFYGTTQSFDTADTPAGWSVGNNTADGGWGFTDIGARGNLTGGTGGFAIVDSDKLGSGKTQDTELRSPILDLTGETAPTLSFNQDFRAFINSTADVDLSVDGGATWQTVAHQSADIRGPRTDKIALAAAAGKANVQVRFHYNGKWSYWWEIDNVSIGHSACEPVRGGLVVGNVLDRNTGDGVNGATVKSDDEPTAKATAAATPDDPNLGDGFYWLFSSQTGTHPFTATGSRYTGVTNKVNVAANWATKADFALAAGRLSVKPGSIRKTVGMGEQATAKVTVKNDGSAPATVEFSERDKGSTVLSAMGPGAPRQDVTGTFSPNRQSKPAGTPKMSTAGVKANATPYAAPWTDMANYPTIITDNAVTFHDGKVYSIGGWTGTAIPAGGSVYDVASGAWSALPNLAVAREKPATAWVGDKLYVVGGWGNDELTQKTVEIYSPATNSWTTGATAPAAYAAAAVSVVGTKLYYVGGCDNSCGTQQVYSYDTVAGTWSRVADYPLSLGWVSCGGIGGAVYCAGGTNASGSTKAAYSYDPRLDAWSPITDLPQDMWASGYAAANGMLLVSGGVTANSTAVTNGGFGYDPATKAWTALPNSNNSVYRGGAACGFYKVGGQLPGAFGSPVNKAEALPGLSDCGGAADVPWLSESPTKVTIAPGRSASVEVTLDASVKEISQPGAYEADLVLNSDTPYPVASIGVTMTVTPPDTWGKITGTVTGTACNGTSTPLAGATVQIDSWAQHYTLRTDAQGRYQLWLDARNSPLDLIVARDGWQPKYKQYKLTAGKTTTANWSLTAAGC